VKSVGIKALKNNLSRYLDLVRQGEVVLVTDRDEVIAELRMPTQPLVTRASPWMAFLEEQARRGSLRLARRKQSLLRAPSRPLATLDVAAALEAVRGDRR
jgi:antitoxin (DNA-binding transcriptional repressor) of toxin-antitoxin stability system